MPHPTPPLGTTLDLWLNRLDAEGFRVGIRERLIVQDFLTRLAARGELPESREATLKLIAPLICTTPDSQRRYAALLQEFLATQPRRRGRRFGRKREGREDKESPPHWLKLIGVAILIVLVLAGLAWRFWPEPEPRKDPTKTKVVSTQVQGQKIQVQDTYTPAPPTARTPPAPPSDRLKPLRWAAWLLAGLSALLLAWAVATRLRRRLYLQGVRSDAQVDEHVLHDPHAGRIEPQTGPIRVASRGLRQRIAGEREVLDLDATLAATIQAAGAFSPRYRLLQHTPEYLALIDRRHPGDHLAAYAEALLQALVEHGVTVQVYSFEGSPDHGCWRLRQGAAGREAFDRSGMAELAGRYGGHRLLIFGEADALVDPLTGAPRPWTKQLGVFRQRAWFTPMPLPSWGAAEEAADAQGFLVLPMPAEALTTLAGWFSSGDLSLAAGADWPLAYPTLLRNQAVAWVARQSAPPEDTLKELLYQLRAYLGPARYQWLCACAIFPSLSPTLSLALGKELSLDARELDNRALDNRELALGMATLGALPWFRHGRMPAWLRQTLLAELTPENEARYREVIQQRLAGALAGEASAGGAELARVATRRKLWAWLSRGSGPARDVVLVDFLRKDTVSRLAQALPEPLRQRLFRNGLAAQGLRPALLAGVAGLCAVFLGLALFLPHQAPFQPPGATLHPIAIHLVGCPDSTGVDAATRALADELAALSPVRLGITQAGAYLAPTAYTPAAWEKAHGQPAPGAGAIRHGAGYAGQAARLRDWLQPRIGAWINPASTDTPAALIANVCVNPLVPPKNGQAKAPGISIYIQIGAEAQRPWAERISERLRQIPKVSIHVELLDMKRLPNRIEVRSRVGGNPDFLKRIADELSGSLGTPAVTKALQLLKSDPANANVYEIWASNRLCIQDLSPACGAATAKPAAIREFLATRPTIPAGESSDLCYVVENAARLNLDPGRQVFKNTAKGCVTVKPGQTTTYTLTAYARDGAETARAVTVRVREAANSVPVPRLTGQSADQAVAILAKLGLKAEQTVQAGTLRARPGTVLDQKPAAGGAVPPGSVVMLIVASSAPVDAGWCCLPPAQNVQQQARLGLVPMGEKACAEQGGRFFRDEKLALSQCTDRAMAENAKVPAGWERVNVFEVQELLAKTGYYKGPVDGVARDELIKALMMFQEKTGQVADGMPGPRTLSILRGEARPPTAPSNLRLQN